MALAVEGLHDHLVFAELPGERGENGEFRGGAFVVLGKAIVSEQPACKLIHEEGVFSSLHYNVLQAAKRIK